MIAASLVSHPAAASSRLVSVAFNSQAQAPQQFGSDEFRQKLLALSGKRLVVDYRGNGAWVAKTWCLPRPDPAPSIWR